jgi:hypothetical protein
MMEPVRAPPVPIPEQGQCGLACAFCGRALHSASEISVHTTACAHERIDKLEKQHAELLARLRDAEAVLIEAGLMQENRP